jgi:hypothetical protein
LINAETGEVVRDYLFEGYESNLRGTPNPPKALRISADSGPPSKLDEK